MHKWENMDKLIQKKVFLKLLYNIKILIDERFKNDWI